MGQSKEYPAIRAYVDKVHQRPAYIRALAIGGPYDYAS
jgi:glutathione S-transferase